MRHRQPKGPETDRPVLNHRVTSRLYTFDVVTPRCARNRRHRMRVDMAHSICRCTLVRRGLVNMINDEGDYRCFGCAQLQAQLLLESGEQGGVRLLLGAMTGIE